jgi:hypothetical protein
MAISSLQKAERMGKDLSKGRDLFAFGEKIAANGRNGNGPRREISTKGKTAKGERENLSIQYQIYPGNPCLLALKSRALITTSMKIKRSVGE